MAFFKIGGQAEDRSVTLFMLVRSKVLGIDRNVLFSKTVRTFSEQLIYVHHSLALVLLSELIYGYTIK